MPFPQPSYYPYDLDSLDSQEIYFLNHNQELYSLKQENPFKSYLYYFLINYLLSLGSHQFQALLIAKPALQHRPFHINPT